MDYAPTYLDTKLTFFSIHIVLNNMDSDAEHLEQNNISSQIAVCHLRSSYPLLAPTIPKLAPNAPILVNCKILQSVVASTAEAKISGLYHNFQTIIQIHILFEVVYNEQPLIAL